VFSKLVFRLLLAVFALIFGAAICWFLVSLWDIFIPGPEPSQSRFDTTDMLDISAVLAAKVAAPSGVLWTHYRREGSYHTSEQMFLGIWITQLKLV
jgi:hypothetical protein